MLFTKACEYGIRAALYVAAQPPDACTPTRDISARLDISSTFLAKIAQTLTQAGIFRATRGPQGGVGLARPAEAIALIDIVRAIDGDGLFSDCALGLPGCDDRSPCPMHAAWSGARGRIATMLASATLASVSADVLTLGLRLAPTPPLTPLAPGPAPLAEAAPAGPD